MATLRDAIEPRVLRAMNITVTEGAAVWNTHPHAQVRGDFRRMLELERRANAPIAPGTPQEMARQQGNAAMAANAHRAGLVAIQLALMITRFPFMDRTAAERFLHWVMRTVLAEQNLANWSSFETILFREARLLITHRLEGWHTKACGMPHSADVAAINRAFTAFFDEIQQTVSSSFSAELSATQKRMEVLDPNDEKSKKAKKKTWVQKLFDVVFIDYKSPNPLLNMFHKKHAAQWVWFAVFCGFNAIYIDAVYSVSQTVVVDGGFVQSVYNLTYKLVWYAVFAAIFLYDVMAIYLVGLSALTSLHIMVTDSYQNLLVSPSKKYLQDLEDGPGKKFGLVANNFFAGFVPVVAFLIVITLSVKMVGATVDVLWGNVSNEERQQAFADHVEASIADVGELAQGVSQILRTYKFRAPGSAHASVFNPDPLGAKAGGNNPNGYSYSAPLTEVQQLVLDHCASRGLDPALVMLLMKHESSFNPQATSPRGAVGLMQIMPATGMQFGANVQELYTPSGNIQAGCRYLEYLRERFSGSRWNRSTPEKLWLAAYHAGPESVERAGGVPVNTHDGLISTREYVGKTFREYCKVREHAGRPYDRCH